MIAHQMAEYLVDLTYDKVPAEIVQASKKHILDLIGCAFGGSNVEHARIIVELVRYLGGPKESTIIAHREKTSCANAAFANGTMAGSFGVGFDDTHHVGAFHPGRCVVTAGLALGERERVSGEDLITAIIAGYEAVVRVAITVQPGLYERGFHPTGVCGGIGAAVSSGRILRLNADKMANAIALAAQQGFGVLQVREPEASQIVTFGGGKAAQNGVIASLLAQGGYRGCSKIFEGKFGFCETYAGECDLSKLTSGLGKQFRILEVGIKPYPCSRHTHAGIMAALRIAHEHKVPVEDIEKVTCRTFDMGVRGRDKPWFPSSGWEAKSSYQYVLSVALLDGKVTVESFTQDRLADSRLQELVKKIKIVSDPDLTKLYPEKWPSIVEVTTTKGDKFQARVDYPPGDLQNPLSNEQIVEKFRNLASKVLTQAKIDDLIEMITSLEKLSDVRELTNLLAS